MKDNAMSKAQTDVVAALRIELDATKAALAKVVAERDALTKQVADLKARLKAAAGCIQRDELGSQVNWPDRLDAALNLKLKSWRKGGK